ncbi:MAG: hypothetical protein GYB68_20005, partial [Chloroflexi bacterium]|nr:hypothetical protein [Chloroflexota bacterium]
MVDPPASHQGHAWEQWDWVWYIAAGIAWVVNVTLGASSAPDGSLALFLGLSALLVLWYLPFIVTPAERWRETPGRGLLSFIIGWLLWGGLLVLTLQSLLLAAVFFPILFTRLPIRQAIAAALFQSVYLYVLFIVLSGTEDWLLLLIIALGLFVAATLIGLFISALVSQSLERQRLVDELSQSRASLLRAEREAGVLAERQRLARDIHDTLAQQFTSIIMHLSAARLRDSGSRLAQVEQAEQAARVGLEETRRMIWNMRPQIFEHLSLLESLEAISARWSVESAVKVSMVVTGTPYTLPPAVNVAFLRITQEALHNVRKHAQAQHVTITLSYMPGNLALDLADDGQGFDL